MSIVTIRQELSDISGVDRLTMQYEDGGKVEVYTIGEIAVRVKPGANAAEIRAAFLEAMPE